MTCEKTLLRQATLADARAILDIYAPYVNKSGASFEVVTPSLSEFACRMQRIMEQHPYLAVERDGKIVGYAYADRHKERAAYQWNVEYSIYLHSNCTGQGLGSKLLCTLLEFSSMQGLHNVFNSVTLPNPASVLLQERQGFTLWGVMPKVGYKFGQWLDVACYYKRIASAVATPQTPIAFKDLPAAKINAVLERFSDF